MVLRQSDITRGAVAFFDVDVLHADESVKVKGSVVDRPGSGCANGFVCVENDAASGTSRWLPLTGSDNGSRLLIDPSWVCNSYGNFEKGLVWLQDGRNVYRGPNAVFIEASRGENEYTNGRPVVNNQGMERIVDEMNGRQRRV